MQFDCIVIVDFHVAYLLYSVYFFFHIIHSSSMCLYFVIFSVINFMYHIYRRHHYHNSFFV